MRELYGCSTCIFAVVVQYTVQYVGQYEYCCSMIANCKLV